MMERQSRQGAMTTFKPAVWVLVVCLWMSSTAAAALTLSVTPDLIKRFPASSRRVEFHPFSSSAAATPSIRLFRNGKISFQDSVQRLIRSGMSHPLLRMRTTTSSQAFLRTGGPERHEVRFFVGEIPVCGFQVVAHRLSDRSALVLGEAPEIDPGEPAPAADWPDLELAFEKAAAEVAGATQARTITAAGAGKCFFVRSGSLLPVWSISVMADGMPYTVLADGYEVVGLSRDFFDVTGTANVFEFNRLSGQRGPVELPDLTGDGTLTSSHLRTYVPEGYQRVVAQDHNFDVDPGDIRFDEIQVFAHAQKHFKYFTDIGFEWYGPAPLEIRIHVKPAGRINNALFVPGNAVGNTVPTISIHDGDGVDLQYLITDGDVVSHEFGHHVVYRTLRSTEGESLVLHEGLADFFAFSRTGDSCLGESICPQGSLACVVEGQCLRTASIDLKFDDATWNKWAGPKYKLGHLHGQLISGMLWDLRSSGAIPPDDLATLVLRAVSYFKETSGFRDLMLAMFTADHEFFGKKYFGHIQNAGINRGLLEYYSDVDPNKPLPVTTGTSGSNGLQPGDDDEDNTENKGDENPLKCGVTGPEGQQDTPWLLVLLLLPALLAWPVPMGARVRIRRSGKHR